LGFVSEKVGLASAGTVHGISYLQVLAFVITGGMFP
jgi:hypothetical protein